MEASWGLAEALLAYPQLADLLGERHRIIGNNWQNAATAQLIARYLRRAVAVMERVDFAPAALRKDLAGARSAPVRKKRKQDGAPGQQRTGSPGHVAALG